MFHTHRIAAIFALGAAAALSPAASWALPANTYLFGDSENFTGELVLNDLITLSSVSQGWYDNSGFHDPANPDYIVGNVSVNNASYNDYFVFDLSSITGPITSATLTLFNPGTGFIGSSALYTNYDVTTPITALTAFTTTGTGVYADLDSGNSYASTSVDGSANNSTLRISLNAQALADITGDEGGSFAIGGTLFDTPAGTPLPASLPLLCAALAGLVIRGRKKRRLLPA